MLIQKLKCPYGCSDSIFTENTRTITVNDSNLLLDSSAIPSQVSETIKTYVCQCCGNSFDTHQKNDNGRIVL